MKLLIPRCGDAAILNEDWTFTLQNEYRNEDLFKLIKGKEIKSEKQDEPVHGRDYWREHNRKKSVTLEKGTELIFDRIYIRQDNKEFASVTFLIKEHANEALVGERFWAKLDDVNNIVCTMTTRDNPVGGFAKAAYKAAIKKRNNPELVVKAQKAATLKAQLIDAEKACIAAINDPKNKKFLDGMVSIVKKHYNQNKSFWGWGLSTYKTLEQRVRFDLTYDYYNAPYKIKPEDRLWLSRKSTKQKDGSCVRKMRYSTRFARKQVKTKDWRGMDTFYDGCSLIFGGFDVTTDANGKITSVVPVEVTTPT